MKKKLCLLLLLSLHTAQAMNQNSLRELKRSASSKVKSDKKKSADESTRKKHSRSCETLPKQTERKKLQRSMSENDHEIAPTTRKFSEKHSSKKSSPIYTRIPRSPGTKKHTSPLTDIAEERKEKNNKINNDYSQYITLNKKNKDIVQKQYSNQETILIWAARNNQSLLIEKILEFQNVSINAQKNDGNTALHLAAQTKNTTSINLLLHDHRTDASIKNYEGKTAREMIIGNTDNDKESRRKIFAKIMLDIIINNTCNDNIYTKMLTDNNTSQEELEETITQAIDFIKNEFFKDQDKQSDDRELPASAQFPTFAGDDFIRKTILYRLQK